MTETSYPLMALARAYGVAYADILLWAAYLRDVRVHGVQAIGRRVNAFDAYIRIGKTLTPFRRAELTVNMALHADRRWGAHDVMMVARP